MTSRIITKNVLAEALHPHGDFHEQLAKLDTSIKLNIDSRTLTAEDIFLAIRGDLNDGHNFIADALTKNVRLIIADVERKDDFAHVPSIIFVKDTLRFLGAVARAHLLRLKTVRIGITGSNGKTTTKEMIKAALAHIAGAQNVYASLGNKNNLFGLPLCALEVKPHHRFAIFEMGMNQVGEMERLCAIAQPDVAVITNISDAHSGNFADGIVGVRNEKGQLYRSINNNLGHAVINIDDEHCMSVASNEMSFASRVTFGHLSSADVHITKTMPFAIDEGVQRVTVTVDNQDVLIAVPIAGAHHAMNAACALATVHALGLPLNEAALGITNMDKIDGRMSIVRTDKGCLLINDGYNANPTSMKAGILASLELPSTRRIAIIGAMSELGNKAEHHHFELGTLLVKHFDYIFVCGEASAATVAGARHSGCAQDRIVFRQASHELIDPIKAMVQTGDLLFIKGSLSANMQAVAKALA